MARRINRDAINRVCGMIDFSQKFNVYEVAERVKDIFVFDAEAEEKKFRARQVRQVLSNLRDADGKRRCLALGRKGDYIDVEKSTDIAELKRVRRGLRKQQRGLNRSITKVTARMKQIDGQMMMFDIEGVGRG